VRAVPVAVHGRLLLVVSDQLGQHPGERVDLVSAQLGAGCEPRRPLAEDALEAQHETEARLPGRRRRAPAGCDLRDGFVEGTAPGRSRGKRKRRVLVGPEEGLAGPCFGLKGGGGKAVRLLRRSRRMLGGFLHVRSTIRVLQLREVARSLNFP